MADRRTGAPCSPAYEGISGGSHSANSVAPRGEASSETLMTGRPVSRSADTSGSLEVADASTNVGDAPYRAQTRRSRRSTCATCEPNTPR